VSKALWAARSPKACPSVTKGVSLCHQRQARGRQEATEARATLKHERASHKHHVPARHAHLKNPKADVRDRACLGLRWLCLLRLLRGQLLGLLLLLPAVGLLTLRLCLLAACPHFLPRLPRLPLCRTLVPGPLLLLLLLLLLVVVVVVVVGASGGGIM